MYNYLDRIENPSDIKKLSLEEIDSLSKEIRDYLLESVSQTGGHLASNLGVVELTLALFNTLDLEKDKIIWDVGHQSYVHKILTGRKDQMNTIRQLNGISGFPKRDESKYDSFDTGHSSTSISALVGMARARDLQGTDENLVAVIGDGALTGGMAFEALNDIGKRQSKIIVVLNDNEMSISENVGGLSLHLSRARVRSNYVRSKKNIERVLKKIPIIGKPIYKFIYSGKQLIKKAILPRMMFEEIGFTYLGPIDGHNFKDMSKVMDQAMLINKPVLIHVCTKKGKGYKPAEDKPNVFHGVGKFDVRSGKLVKKSGVQSFSNCFGEHLMSKAESNEKIVAVSAAMLEGTGLKNFSDKYPDRTFDVGIAEQHAVTMAAGMATYGFTPVVAIYSTFFQRAFDQIIHDVCLQNLHVVFCIDRAGIVGNDGETHQGLFDINMFANIPNMIVLAPSNNQELEIMMDYAIDECEGPVAIRYPRGGCDLTYREEQLIDSNAIASRKPLKIRDGDDLTIVSYGRFVKTAIELAEKLEEQNGIKAAVFNMRFIKPLYIGSIYESADITKKMLILDEAMADNYVTNKILMFKSDDIRIDVRNLGPDFVKHGDTNDVVKDYCMDVDSLYLTTMQSFFYDDIFE